MEVSFNYYGERGVVDIVAWHPLCQTLLLVELKTKLVNINELLGVADRRRRLAAVFAEPFGWVPKQVAQWIVLAPGRTNERRVAGRRRDIGPRGNAARPPTQSDAGEPATRLR